MPEIFCKIQILGENGLSVIMNESVVFGAGGHAKVVLDCVEMENKFKIVIAIDDDSEKQGHFLVNNVPIYARDMFDGDYKFAILGIGDNITRRKIYESFVNLVIFPAIFHPKSSVSKHAVIKGGSILMAGSVVEANSMIGTGCIINTNASVNHDCVVGDFVHIAPGATLCGGVHVGEEVLIGAGSTVLPNVKIGKGCIIGAGSVVTKDVPPQSVGKGVPFRAKDKFRGF